MNKTIQQQLSSSDPLERRNALEELFGEPLCGDVLALVARAISDPDRGVRDIAAQLLAGAPSQQAARQIVEHIASRDITIRNLAGDTLIKMGEYAIESLIPFIDAEDKDVRKFAIDLLALLPAHKAIDRIAKRLNDPEPNVVCAVIGALGSLHAVEYSGALLESYHTAPYARADIITALAQFSIEEHLNFFTEALQDDDPVVQLTAAEALAGYKDASILEKLYQKIEEVSSTARSIILQSIISIIDAHPDENIALPHSLKVHFLEMLNDFDLDYVCAAVRGLQHYQDPDIVDRLISKMGVADQLDLQIYHTISQTGINVITKILHAAREEVISPQAAARFVLGLASEYAMTDEHIQQDPAVEKMSVFIKNHFHILDVEAKLSSIEIFKKFGFPNMEAIINEALRDEESLVRSFALEAVRSLDLSAFTGALYQLYEDEDEGIRQAALELLDEMEPDQKGF